MSSSEKSIFVGADPVKASVDARMSNQPHQCADCAIELSRMNLNLFDTPSEQSFDLFQLLAQKCQRQ
jgi:hypothetical protein